MKLKGKMTIERRLDAPTTNHSLDLLRHVVYSEAQLGNCDGNVRSCSFVAAHQRLCGHLGVGRRWIWFASEDGIGIFIWIKIKAGKDRVIWVKV